MREEGRDEEREERTGGKEAECVVSGVLCVFILWCGVLRVERMVRLKSSQRNHAWTISGRAPKT